MDELFEILTWAQLGLHQKPIGLINIDGYYDGLLQQIQRMIKDGLLKAETADMLQTGNTLEEVMAKMNTYVAPPKPKWLTEERT